MKLISVGVECFSEELKEYLKRMKVDVNFSSLRDIL
jgi:hypothetical protein